VTNTPIKAELEIAEDFVYGVSAWRGRSPQFMQAQVGKLAGMLAEHHDALFISSVGVIEACDAEDCALFDARLDSLRKAVMGQGT
jgi:hypothetical protein